MIQTTARMPGLPPGVLLTPGRARLAGTGADCQRNRNAPLLTGLISIKVATLLMAHRYVREVKQTVLENATRTSPARRGPCGRTTTSAGSKPQVKGQHPVEDGCGDCPVGQTEVRFLYSGTFLCVNFSLVQVAR